MTASILIVDDEADIRNLVKGILEDEGYKVYLASNSQEAYARIESHLPNLVVLDIWLQGSQHDGIQILEKVKENYPYVPVVMISGHGTIETAVAAIKKGAYDFIEKPFKSDRLILMIQRALEAAELRRENEVLRQQAVMTDDLIGSSSAMQGLQQVLDRVAPTNSRVLLTGEPGSGKDVVARYIHKNSLRAGKPFLALSCATLRPDRLEAELFGSEDGIPGEPTQTGVLEKANGGTLLLDEVADMPLETQGKIVRALQSQTFQRVGGSSVIQADVRIIACTNRNLEQEIAQGRFRQDLFYRLNVVPIAMPPLRDRASDIPELADYFVKALSGNSAIPTRRFAARALAALQAYPWPGNIRQLRNVIEWIVIMNGKGGQAERPYDLEHLPPEIAGTAQKSKDGSAGPVPFGDMDFTHMPLREARELFERNYLLSQIVRFGGNISRTAQFVGMERSALHRKMKTLNLILNEDKPLSSSEKSKKRA